MATATNIPMSEDEDLQSDPVQGDLSYGSFAAMDFIILNVNGVDLSKATHEEAVEAFKNADEPIIVQVLRRATRNKATGDKDCATLCNVGTQTDLQSEDLLWKVLQRCPSPLDTSNGGIVIDGLCEISPQEQMTVIDDDLMHDLNAMDNLDIPIIDEDGMDKAYEMEYEDITLTRGSDGTKLGLTLCCFREEDAGVIISEVDPNSIAGDDGRIRAGDQILQINGEDVLNNDQALSLFAQKSDTTSIIVCRSQLQLQYDECLFDENSLLEDIQLDMLEQTHQEAMQFTSCLLAEHDSTQLDDDSKTDTTGTTETTSLHHEKDSGVGRATDESVRNDESSGQENIPDDCSSTHQKYPAQQPSLGSRDLRYSNDSFISNGVGDPEFPGHEISLEDCMKFQAALESKCDKHMRSDTDESMRGKESKVMRLGSDSMETTSLSGDSLSRTSRNRSGASDQDEGTNHRDASKSNVWVTQQNGQKGLIPNGKPQGSPEEPEYHGCEQESRKLEMIVENGQVGSPTHRPTDLGLDSLRNSDTHLPQISPHEQDTKTMTSSSSGSTRQHRAPRTVPGSPSRSKSSSGSRDRSKSSSSSGSSKEKTSPVKVATSRKDCPVRQTPPPHPSIPYQRRPATNPHMRSQQFVHRNPYFLQQEEAAAHLITQNWKLQQQNLQLKKSLESLGPNQKLHSCQSIMSIPSHAKHYRSYLHLVNQNEENSLGTSQPNKKIINRDEWKVKIRSDGTRYITKKNTRGKILKDRANKIQEERGGLTTDDEAVSEMKLGKYWSKEDRKRHLERARDQRLRREYMMQSRMECLQEQMEEDGKKEPNIVELSQRKMLRKKSARKMMLDDFTTVEEMLVHGTRVSPETAKTFCSNPLLNVTTV
ncbi:E3 ubiquitin-protein ligase PDZRN3-like isoform X2 [Asterias amurensis]|uniref:E3 ubiquitin-protein ligase PDZRN3-like isoform X2 n=1 Tax=Asterias amurensis TaxID=7602 RepID=UPI003AB2E924